MWPERRPGRLDSTFQRVCCRERIRCSQRAGIRGVFLSIRQTLGVERRAGVKRGRDSSFELGLSFGRSAFGCSLIVIWRCICVRRLFVCRQRAG
ncbi:MAG: hypothetical protein JOZ39_02200 [Chloroflexi bacterium]|nr:hypothetical protein [Chloroflexota bacterium]